MKIAQHKKLYFPALSILAIVLMLLIFISISTFRNLHRQKSNMLQLINREGIVLLDALEAGARSGITMQGWNADALGNLIREVGTNQDIAYIFLFDRLGNVIYSIASEQIEKPDISAKQMTPAMPIQSRLVHLPNGQQVYELAKLFDPHLIKGTFGASEHMLPHISGEMMDHHGCTIVLGLKMLAIAEVRRADTHHAIIMGVIVSALGAGVLFFFFVIQKYVRVNQALQQAQDYTRQVVASLATGLVSIDSQGVVKSFNRPALKLLDTTAQTLQGKPLNQLLDFSITGISQTLTDRRSVLEREILHKSQKGVDLPLAISVTPIKEAGDDCCGAVILLRDLSEIKDLEAQMRRAEKLAAVGEMAASVAHEIRNPLSSIKGFAQFLHKRFKEGATEQEYTNIMIQEVNRINAVVTDLIALSRPMDATRAPTDVTELINRGIQLIHRDAEERDITIKKNLKTDDLTYSMDADQLTQALLNLLLNATSAIGRNGTITIGAETDFVQQELLLWVEDDGPGIAPDLHEKIFEPFFTMREKGTGLGLAIVRKIVEHNKGSVDLLSPAQQSKKGTRFTIHLPLSGK